MRRMLLAAVLFWLSFLVVSPLQAGQPLELTLYTGQLTQDDFIEAPFSEPDLEKRYLLALSLRKELFPLREVVAWSPKRIYCDLEGVLVHKWGDWLGIDQSFQEVAGSFNLRYEFPDNWINLDSFSFGNGLSLTTEEPEYEKEVTLNGKTSNLLYYLLVDVAFDIPFTEELQAVVRMHHRSGVYGLIDNVDGGSNYLCLGLRYPLDFLSF